MLVRERARTKRKPLTEGEQMQIQWPWSRKDNKIEDNKDTGSVVSIHVHERATEKPEFKPGKSVPFPEACIPTIPANGRGLCAYSKVANRVGFMPTELVRVLLIRFFATERIKTYNRKQVYEWLTSMRWWKGINRQWYWRPLRENDVMEYGVFGENFASNGAYDCNFPECLPYARMVPLEILSMALKIKTRFGDDVKFFVSDPAAESKNGGRFIMVVPSGIENLSYDVDESDYQLIFGWWEDTL